ncbi:MAG: hypothetical protein H6766_02940 [Candidatus Peribacteria bacterium]|nr:MAG: hypothetical protein H6766_02940 [Candidatus Peribacteria bacterium]
MKLLNNNSQTPDNVTPTNGDDNLGSLQSSLMEGVSPAAVPEASTTTAAQNEQSLIQKLLQEKQANTQKVSKIDALNNGQMRSLSASEVANMRYKFFTLALLIFAIIARTSFVQPTLNTYVNNRQSLADARTVTEKSTAAIATAQSLNSFADVVEQEEESLTTCINADSDCDDETAPLLSYINNQNAARKQAQYYLQIGDLSDPKLLVDEKSILTNIDLFLLRFGPGNVPQRTNIGDIASIVISDPVLVQGKMYSVDIELIVNFPNNESLINFLNNAENRIISNDAIDLPPILYKVQEVGYDITKYNESQDTTIKLTAYYYKDDTTTR